MERKKSPVQGRKSKGEPRQPVAGGSGNKKKKKVSGAEKTAQKTERKAANKIKKELNKTGEEDIEQIVQQIENENRQRNKISEREVDPPSRRLNFTFIPHPDKEELIMYGGEYYNGQKTFIYPDLYFYNIKSNKWFLVKSPNSPPPRCAHQMCASSVNKGQLWVFGGEYASPNETQFYHYRDLWLFHIAEKRWEKITAPKAPNGRSGHRMVYQKKKLYIFGGFHDNLRDYKYYNDMHCFDTESRTWVQLEIKGAPPSPRSGCVMVALADGRIFIYGGYSKERIKKDVDQGHIYKDAFFLVPEKDDESGLKFKWASIKIGGVKVSRRCGMPATLAVNKRIYCFGGVFDENDTEEKLDSTFYDDLFILDLDKLTWRSMTITGKKDIPLRKERDEVELIERELASTMFLDDGTFKVTIGPTKEVKQILDNAEMASKKFWPSPRMNSGLVFKGGLLFIYGGMYEDKKKEVTYEDFYSLDTKKLDVWKILVKDELDSMIWEGSDSSSCSSGSDSECTTDDDSSSTQTASTSTTTRITFSDTVHMK